MSVPERLLLLLDRVPYLSAWLWFQAAAGVLSALVFVVLSRGRPELRTAFVWSLPFGVLSAGVLGTLFRALDRFVFGTAQYVTFGVAIYGALAGMALAYALKLQRGMHSVPAGLDRLSPSLLLLAGVGRLGCFAGGCDAGGVASVPWAVRFPATTQTFREHARRGLVLPSDELSLAVHPAQLYEALPLLLLAAVAARALSHGKLRGGSVFMASAAGYAVLRAGVDLSRDVHPTPSYGQWTSLFVLLGIGALYLRENRAAWRRPLRRPMLTR